MKIDLMKFCSKYRKEISEPFSKGEWTYATNGHIAIQVPMLLHILEKKEAPDAEKIFKEADEHGPYQWVPVPEVEIQTVRCEDCTGTGEIQDEPCEECDGEGNYQKGEAVRFPLNTDPTTVVGLNSIYLDLIRKELPNPQIGLTEKAESINWANAKPVKIKFDGGSGLLMPMRI